MVDEPRKQKPVSDVDMVVQRLVKETNITDEQARELIALLGITWSSLIREARLLSSKR